LKIDQSFVSEPAARKPPDESVVRAIVGIASEFGLLPTAEGVETPETRSRLVELGSTKLQDSSSRTTTAMTTSSSELLIAHCDKARRI